MKQINVKTETDFDSILHKNSDGQEFWYARELMPLLGYKTWEGFSNVIKKAITSLKKTYPQIEEHFRHVSKKITIASGTKNEAAREIDDYKLTRRACYLIAQNGDSRKEAIALAQNYFASQTRKQELQDIKEKDIERILARRKLSETEKKFSGILTERGVDGRGIAEVKSSGDEALFGKPTREVKNTLGINKHKPLADHLPTISIKAKDLATEMSTYNTQEKQLQGKSQIKSEHVRNNAAVRKMLTESGIYPERLAVEEDVKKLEKKYSEHEISDIADNKILELDILEIDITDVTDKSELQRISSVINSNQGNSKLRIYYGKKDAIKTIERDIQINPEVINGLRKYLVITKDVL